MSELVPHLLLRANGCASHASTLLRTAGYMVSTIHDDAIAEQIAGASHVDGVVVELPAPAAIGVARRIAARYGRDVVVLVITAAAEAVRNALPRALVVRPAELDDDLISTIDLALVAQQMQHAN